MLNMLTFKYILFLLLVSDVTFGGFLNIDMKKCLKRNGLFPKVGSYCKSYYKCSNWVPVEITCPEDEIFNPIAGWCDWIEAFPCLDKPKREECPRENGKFLKPGTKCKSYYDCCNGEPTEMTCPRDSLFDPSNEKCEWPELYTCIEGISTKDIISSTFNPFIRSSTNEVRPSTDTTNYETSQYPEVSSPQTTIDPYTQPTTDDIRFSSIATDATYKTSQYPEISSPQTTLEPYTEPTTDDIRFSSIATDATYKTSQYPEISSPQTTLEPYTEPTTDYIRLSSIATDATYETSQYPEGSSPQTNPDTKYTEEEVKSSSLFTGISDSSYRTSYPYTRSSIGELQETTIAPYDPTSSYGTFQPYTKSSSAVVEETSQPVDIWCPEPSGYFPHPTNRNKFVGCIDGKPTVMDCPANLVYNHKKRRCDYK